MKAPERNAVVEVVLEVREALPFCRDVTVLVSVQYTWLQVSAWSFSLLMDVSERLRWVILSSGIWAGYDEVLFFGGKIQYDEVLFFNGKFYLYCFFFVGI